MSKEVTKNKTTIDTERLLKLADDTLKTEALALETLRETFPSGRCGSFCRVRFPAFELQGRVVVSGMGKSGHIGRKIAATLASTGTPAMFVHPAEAAHGDLGMITHDDVFIAFPIPVKREN